MPSPTATMRPTSAETRLASKSLSLSLMTSEISLVLMPNFFLLGRREPAPQLLQSRGHTGVDDVIAVLKPQAAEDARVDDHVQAYLFLEPPRQLACDTVAILRRELDRGRDRGPHATCGVVGEAVELVFHVLCVVDAAGFDQEPGEVGRFGVEQVRRPGDELLACLGRDRRVAQHQPHVWVRKQLTNLRQAA